jgi:hypothetical protein
VELIHPGRHRVHLGEEGAQLLRGHGAAVGVVDDLIPLGPEPFLRLGGEGGE